MVTIHNGESFEFGTLAMAQAFSERVLRMAKRLHHAGISHAPVRAVNMVPATAWGPGYQTLVRVQVERNFPAAVRHVVALAALRELIAEAIQPEVVHASGDITALVDAYMVKHDAVLCVRALGAQSRGVPVDFDVPPASIVGVRQEVNANPLQACRLHLPADCEAIFTPDFNGYSFVLFAKFG